MLNSMKLSHFSNESLESPRIRLMTQPKLTNHLSSPERKSITKRGKLTDPLRSKTINILRIPKSPSIFIRKGQPEHQRAIDFNNKDDLEAFFK